MLLHHIAVVSESKHVGLGEIVRVSAALQIQISRDFTPLWGIGATISGFQTLEDVPIGYWPIVMKDDIGVAGAGGIHQDQDGQPFALVDATPDWSLIASHECLEMLADPYGNRVHAAPSLQAGQGQVEFLVEVCDAVENPEFAYSVNGVQLSDFVTPHYFDSHKLASRQYSFTGSVSAPRQVLAGGYLSWKVPATNEWWQETYFGTTPAIKNLGSFTLQDSNLRLEVDRRTPERLIHIRRNPDLPPGPLVTPPDGPINGGSRASQIHSRIATLLGQA